MSRTRVIGTAVGCALIVTGLVSAAGAGAATSAVVKCPNYAQLIGGGREEAFTNVRATNVSCATALIVMDVFVNTTPGRTVEGFTCTRQPDGKRAHTAKCVKKATAVTFSYTT